MDEPFVVRKPTGPPPLLMRLAAVLVVPLVLSALFATGQKAVDNYRLNREADALRSQVIALRSENIQLQQDIEQSRTDAAIETIAREQMGLVKPGDHPLVLVPPSGQPAAAPTAVPSPPPPAPAWRQWWEYLFG
jgi:cell division protein FtsL